jgi:uncharacterized protein
MKIIVSGGTGFIGRNLIPALLKKGDEVTVLTRDESKVWSRDLTGVSKLSWEKLDAISSDNFDAIINLSGENISQARWSVSVKNKIKDSRINATKKLVQWVLKATSKKPHIYNASAVGIYGVSSSENSLATRLTENTKVNWDHPTDFLSEVGQSWENETKPAVEAHIPVTLMRFGVVLKRKEGLLKKLEPSFNLGLGSVLGSGNQAITWIHIDDLVRGILFLLNHPNVTGPVNLCSPGSVTQKDFAKKLARVMHRPLMLRMPGFVVKSLFGQMGEELLLGGQNVYPERLKQLGFEFLYPDLESALKKEWGDIS